jgi:hypothetical protein
VISRRAIRGALAFAALIVATTVLLTHFGVAHLGSRPEPHDRPGWVEAAWTLPLDNWGLGRVWRADGAGVTLFARTKTGFCNCFNGVADDTEIDRIGDVDLHGDDFTPVAPGHVTIVGDLVGRERAFTATSRWSSRHVVSIVAASDCKAVVATLVSDQPIPPTIEASAVALLTGESFRQWAANQ